MKTPEEVEDTIVESFLSAGSAFNQFNRLLAIASDLEEMPEEDMVDGALVEGCQSQVWLYVDATDGTVNIEGESDTLMVRGVIRILELMFDGQPCDVVAHARTSFVERTELANIFDAQRQTGVASIIQTIQRCAADHGRFPVVEQA